MIFYGEVAPVQISQRDTDTASAVGGSVAGVAVLEYEKMSR